VLDCVDSEAVPVCVPLKDAVDVVDGACASARTSARVKCAAIDIDILASRRRGAGEASLNANLSL